MPDSDHSITSVPPQTPLPADDPARTLTVADADDSQLRHVFLAGDIYTIVVPGSATNGRYCLIDMLVNAGGGPQPHRHDFEETFAMLEGELEFTFRGKTQTVRAPTIVNIPANAPHVFHNASGKTVHMLCTCTPAGQDEYFAAIGTAVASRSGPIPHLSEEEQKAKQRLAEELAPKFRTEFLKTTDEG